MVTWPIHLFGEYSESSSKTPSIGSDFHAGDNVNVLIAQLLSAGNETQCLRTASLTNTVVHGVIVTEIPVGHAALPSKS